jgi:flagellar basal body-associated protein FliL
MQQRLASGDLECRSGHPNAGSNRLIVVMTMVMVVVSMVVMMMVVVNDNHHLRLSRPRKTCQCEKHHQSEKPASTNILHRPLRTSVQVG